MGELGKLLIKTKQKKNLLCSKSTLSRKPNEQNRTEHQQ